MRTSRVATQLARTVLTKRSAIISHTRLQNPTRCAPTLNQQLFWFSSETDKNEKAPVDTAVEEEIPAEDTTTTAEEATEPTELIKAQAEAKDLRDQLLRSLAEQENIRGIAQRDIASARQFAIQSFAKSLLEVSDNLTLALQAVPEERDGPLQTLVEGIEMTEKGLMKAFEKNGLVKFGAVGESFDPNLHEALYEYPDEKQEAGTIGQVMKSGFMLQKRVLRPAEVGVVKAA